MFILWFSSSRTAKPQGMDSFTHRTPSPTTARSAQKTKIQQQNHKPKTTTKFKDTI